MEGPLKLNGSDDEGLCVRAMLVSSLVPEETLL